MKEKKLWIFDYDGVLVFSVYVTFMCIIEAAKKVEVSLPSFTLLRACWGKNFHEDLFPKLAKELNWTYVQKEYVMELFLENNQKLEYPLPDSVNDFLKKAKEKKELAILSNRDLNSLIVSANKLGLDLSIFKRIICPQNALFKPDPEVFKVFWQEGYNPEESLFVGDSINFDLKAAQSHFPVIDFVAISSGLHEKNEFIEAGEKKEFILKSPVEMEKWL